MRTRNSFIFVVMLLSMTLFCISGCGLFADDNEADPYNKDSYEYIDISTAVELNAMESDKAYRLTNDIDLKNSSWTPITVRGFDGAGHVISNCNIEVLSINNEESIGFFSDIIWLENITFENINIKTINTRYVGIAIGSMMAAIDNVVGGFTYDINNVTVHNCSIDYSNTQNTEQYIYVGGIVGQSTIVRNSSVSDSEITVDGGWAHSPCYVGGLSGRSDDISGCDIKQVAINTSKDNASLYVGGLSGYDVSGTVEKSYVSDLHMTVECGSSATLYCGLLIGCNISSEIMTSDYAVNSAVEVTGNGDCYIGGAVGDGRTSIKDCYVTECGIFYSGSAEISCVGGFIGRSQGTVTSCFSANNTISNNAGEGDRKVAGFAGSVAGTCVRCGSCNNSIEGFNRDEFSDKSNFVVDCYVSGEQAGNTNECEILPEADWLTPEQISDKLGLDDSVWMLESGKLPYIELGE